MGCHTWFYKQSKYSLEDLRSIYVSQQEKWIERWKEISSDPNHELREELFPYPQEQFDRCLEIYERQLRMVRNKHIHVDFIYHICTDTDEGSSHYCYADSFVYVCTDDLPHDVFRIKGYPDDILFSMDDTLWFCKAKNIELSKDQKARLRKFWKEYSYGMIRFG